MDRELIQNNTLRTMASLLTIEQFDKIKTYIENLSDEEFNEFVESKRQAAANSAPISLRDLLYADVEALAKSGVSPHEMATNSINITFLNEDLNNDLVNSLSKSRPSDLICLSGADDILLMNLWKDSVDSVLKTKAVIIPSDLFFAGTVPLLDCRIIIDERKDYPGGGILEYRVVVFEDFVDRIQNSKYEDTIVGAVIHIQKTGHKMIMPIIAVKGVAYIASGPLGHDGMSQEYKKKVQESTTVQSIVNMFTALMETWYGIQIALLHPQIENVFRNSKTVVDEAASRKITKKKKNKVKYIRRHILNSDELKSVTNRDSQSRSRRTLAWYVIGHWRRVQGGGKIFVRPHWRGVLRHVKAAVPERDRVIAQTDSSHS